MFMRLMRPLNNWLLKKFVPDWQNTRNHTVRMSYGIVQGYVSIVINILLFVIKFSIGTLVGSTALIADAFHTLGDLASSVALILGFRMARKPGDREHPFGHGRMESIVTLGIAILLILTGFEFFHSGYDRIQEPSPMIFHPWAIVAIAGTILIKEILSHFALDLSQRVQSKAIEADFWHHRSDSIATVLVIVALFAPKFGWPTAIDGYMTIGVALFIIYAGWDIAKSSVDTLIGERPSPELIREIKNRALSVPGVLGVHDLVVHNYGSNNFLSIHVEVSEETSSGQAHDICEEVEALIMTDLGIPTSTHADPTNITDPEILKIREELHAVIRIHPYLKEFHDLRVIGKGDRKNIVFDLVYNGNISQRDEVHYRNAVQAFLKAKFPHCKFAINLEPIYHET